MNPVADPKKVVDRVALGNVGNGRGYLTGARPLGVIGGIASGAGHLEGCWLVKLERYVVIKSLRQVHVRSSIYRI